MLSKGNDNCFVLFLELGIFGYVNDILSRQIWYFNLIGWKLKLVSTIYFVSTAVFSILWRNIVDTTDNLLSTLYVAYFKQ